MKEKKQSIFRFKQFEVRHGLGSMKIGIDGVLVGASCDAGDIRQVKQEKFRILDVGCGCGLIALMAAQKNPMAEITAIDIDGESVKEASLNFSNFPGPNCLEAIQISIDDFSKTDKNLSAFDRILSNPPFYSSGLKNPDSPREKARHQAAFSPFSLLRYADLLLKENGKLCMIALAEDEKDLIEEGKQNNLEAVRICRVRSKEGKPPHRVLLEFRKNMQCADNYKDSIVSDLVLRTEKGEYREEYKLLTKEFYLAF